MKNHLCILPLAALLASAAPSSATTLGLYDGLHVTTWDSFTGITTAGQTPGTASTFYSAALLNTTMTAGSVTGRPAGVTTGPGDRIYSGAGASSNSFSFNISATAAVDLPAFSLLLKYTPALQSGPSASDVTHFNITLNGATTTAPTLIGTSVEGSNNFQLYQWTWASAGLTSGSNINIQATSAAGHVSLDAIQMVPEPSSAMLAGLAAMGVMTRRRRR